ncbi:MAPEG family protein [Colwellia sp. E2M01]|uniref:MAPEG family protein n=1 Tax=Colwellia sp. E2M01 TaxID=2841561 RepID=UPI001C09CB15|nr:MAPEG family protein [Colwellia sp. E2M01]MBU2869515.1 MAPEG family protein [Colwellia sp. E2M01]
MFITIYYAAILALVYIYLTFKTIGARRVARVSIGDGDNNKLSRAIRVHANFAEYVPFAIVLLYFLETQQTNSVLMHILGASLLIARVVHAYGVSQENENLKFRIFGMMTTISVMVFTSVYLLYIGMFFL